MPEKLLAIAREFDVARKVKDIPFHLGAAQHPLVLPVLHQPKKLIKVLNQVLYRSDAISQFPDISHVEARHGKLKQRIERETQKLAGVKDPKLVVTYDTLRAQALHSHFMTVAEEMPEMMFSLPLADVESEGQGKVFQAFGSVLKMTEVCEQTEGQTFAGALLPDVAVEADFEVSSERLPLEASPTTRRSYFRVLNTKPSSRRLLKLSPGAAGVGGRLRADDMAVFLYSEHGNTDSLESGDQVSIVKRRASTQRVAGRRVVAGRYNPPQDHPNL